MAPASSQSRGRSSTSDWATTTRIAVQASMSKVAVESMWPRPGTSAEKPTVTAVSTCPARAAPSSRASCTDSSTSAATASTLGRRSTTRLAGATRSASRASIGVNAGWSG